MKSILLHIILGKAYEINQHEYLNAPLPVRAPDTFTLSFCRNPCGMKYMIDHLNSFQSLEKAMVPHGAYSSMNFSSAKLAPSRRLYRDINKSFITNAQRAIESAFH